MSAARNERFVHDKDGGFHIHLRPDERALLRALPGRLDEALSHMDNPSVPVAENLRRLLPPTYANDEEAEAAFAAAGRGDLVDHHRRALAVLSATANATHVEADELEGWLVAMNDLRLVLGAALEISENQVEFEESDPRYAEWICYQYLSFLQGEVVEALAERLPPPGAGDDELPNDPWGEPPGDLRWDGTPRPDA